MRAQESGVYSSAQVTVSENIIHYGLKKIRWKRAWEDFQIKILPSE